MRKLSELYWIILWKLMFEKIYSLITISNIISHLFLRGIISMEEKDALLDDISEVKKTNNTRYKYEISDIARRLLRIEFIHKCYKKAKHEEAKGII